MPMAPNTAMRRSFTGTVVGESHLVDDAIGGEAELADVFSSRGTLHLGVAGDVSEKDHFVHGLHKG